MNTNLAPSLNAGELPRPYTSRPKRLRKPTPAKVGRRNKVNAWPRVCAVLEAAERPLFRFEIVDRSGVKANNVTTVLQRYAHVIVKSGKPQHTQYALRRFA
jgi:hypothetical protein